MDYAAGHPHWHPITLNEDLRLVEPTLEHAAVSLSWVSSQEIIQFMGADFSSPTLKGEIERIEKIRSSVDELSWMIEHEGMIIGNVCINEIVETSNAFGTRAGCIAILIGDSALWGKGIATQVLGAIIAWAFREGEFTALKARALEKNAGSIRLFQKLGFTEDAIEPYEDTGMHWRNFHMYRSDHSDQ